MLQTNPVYAQPRKDNYVYLTSEHWQVCEDEDKYTDRDPDLLDLIDIVNDRLSRAEALSWVLYSASNTPEHAHSTTAMVIAELIHEALEAHRKQCDNIRRLTKRLE